MMSMAPLLARIQSFGRTIQPTTRIRIATCRRLLSSSSTTNFTDFPPIHAEDEDGKINDSNTTRGQRVWKAQPDINHKHNNFDTKVYHWNEAVDDVKDRRVVDESLARICEQVSLFIGVVYL